MQWQRMETHLLRKVRDYSVVLSRRRARAVRVRGWYCVVERSRVMQLELLPTPTKPTMPLLDALDLVATQWSVRLDARVRVCEESFVGSGGYRIEREAS